MDREIEGARSKYQNRTNSQASLKLNEEQMPESENFDLTSSPLKTQTSLVRTSLKLGVQQTSMMS